LAYLKYEGEESGSLPEGMEEKIRAITEESHREL